MEPLPIIRMGKLRKMTKWEQLKWENRMKKRPTITRIPTPYYKTITAHYLTQREQDEEKEHTDRAKALEVKNPIHMQKSRTTAILETIQETIEENKFEIGVILLYLTFVIIILKTL